MKTDKTQHAAPAHLWASAFIIAALVVVQIGRVTGHRGNEAYGNLVSSVEDYTILTFDAGNEDNVLVMDGRSEELFIYRIANQQRLEFVSRHRLGAIFATGKKIGAGKGG